MSATWFNGLALTIEVGFASAPTTAIGSTSWTEITADVMAVSWKTGRSTELDQFQAGTANLLLDNRDRKYDPNYSSGAYYGQLLPMKRIRIRATYSAVTYDLWAGFVDGWPQSYDVDHKTATVSLNCTDGFKWLSRARLPESVWASVIQDETAVSAWYRLGEQGEITTMADATTAKRDGEYVGTYTPADGLLSMSSNGAVDIDIVAPVARSSYDLLGSTSTWAFDFWVSGLSKGGSSTYTALCFGRQTGTSIQVLVIDFTTYAKLRVQYYQAGTLSSVWDVNVNTDMGGGGTYHVAVTYSTAAGGTCSVYVNGALDIATTGLGSVGPFDPTFSLVPANFTGIDPSYSITIDEIVVWSGALPTASVINRYYSGIIPWYGADTGSQIGRVLDETSWPTGDRTLGTGSSLCQRADLNFQPALSYMQALEATEQGRLYMGPDGKVVFRSRTYTSTNTTSTTSQATFGDSGAELPYSSLEYDYSDTLLKNHVVVSRENGLTVDVRDTTSITAYGEIVDSVTGLLGVSDAEIRDLASYRLAKYDQPGQRITGIEIKPRKAPTTLFAQVLGRIIGDRVTVVRRPQGVGSSISTAVIIEGIETSVTPNGEWSTRWYLSPTETTPFLVLDDATLGRLDFNALGF